MFPTIIDAIALDPGEHIFYTGGRDGKIYIAALNAQPTSTSSYGPHIRGTLSDHRLSILLELECYVVLHVFMLLLTNFLNLKLS